MDCDPKDIFWYADLTQNSECISHKDNSVTLSGYINKPFNQIIYPICTQIQL